MYVRSDKIESDGLSLSHPVPTSPFASHPSVTETRLTVWNLPLASKKEETVHASIRVLPPLPPLPPQSTLVTQPSAQPTVGDLLHTALAHGRSRSKGALHSILARGRNAALGGGTKVPKVWAWLRDGLRTAEGAKPSGSDRNRMHVERAAD